MRKTALILILFLAACGSTDPRNDTVPVRAFLYTNSVNVIMSEGSLCALNRPGRTLEWAGNLGGCPYQYPVQVRMAGQTNAPRTILQKTATAPAGTTLITVIDATGKPHLFIPR